MLLKRDKQDYFESKKKRFLRKIIGRQNDSYFVPERFEGEPILKEKDLKTLRIS